MTNYPTVNTGMIETDFTHGQTELIVDTGTERTLIADDLILDSVKIKSSNVFLTGIANKRQPITTSGVIQENYELKHSKWHEFFNLTDKQLTGPSDGYLGRAFLERNGAIIDLHKNTIYFKKSFGSNNE